MKLTRSANNPILRPTDKNDWESLGVLNPAAWYEDGVFYLLYRAAGDDDEHRITLGLAKSTDGEHFERCFDHPIMEPGIDGPDGNGVEDPRVVKMGKYYYMTYASRFFFSGKYWLEDHKNYGFQPENGPMGLIMNNTATYLAVSEDLVHWRKCGRMTDSRHDDRDVYIFPEKINGKYVMLSRSMQRVGEAYGCERPSIWISYSDDLLEWDNYKLLAQKKFWWEKNKIGGSTPPLKTEKGWLCLYHGVDEEPHGNYHVGAMLLDLNDPEKILARTKEPILSPEEPYEAEGMYSGCVFPTGLVEKDGTLYVYYGAADRFCCVATCKLDELLDYLVNENAEE
ncbi:MAG: glycosidase [Clostridia bacterium]|nr:glycosidase [Clostridia bacterium]